MVDIDDIISDIDKVLENKEEVDFCDWVLEAEYIAKTLTREEITSRCIEFCGVALVIPSVFGVACSCQTKYLRMFAKEVDESYGWGIFVECIDCKSESVNAVPFELLGRERVVASLAVCMREAADGY